jgi:hypothetical protein
MRLTSSVPATVARTTETAAAKPTVASKVSADVKQLGHSIVDGGCFPPPRPQPFPLPTPFPFPLPPTFQPDAKVRGKQGDQLHEIADGMRNGSVTTQESEKLLQEQQAISKATQQAMADGKLSTEEKLKLGLMQARAELNIYQAGHNSSRDVFAGFKSDTRQQASQIDQLANGRTNGNITNTEATELIGQQAQLSDARGDADSPLENALVDLKLANAGKEIAYHSQKGTQLHLKPFPHPLPLPFPKPLPSPFPHPLPELPRPFPRDLPSKPTYEVPTFLKGAIAG